MDYQQFLEGKRVSAPSVGFEVPDASINTKLFPFQRDIVRWALRIGRAAIFADCGLGKTPMQLAWAAAVAAHTNKPVLILTPLAVASQTLREAAKFDVGPAVIAESAADIANGGWDVVITNYHKLHKFDPSIFGGVVLDESSILKNYTGKTKRALTEAFAETPYRLCCTATPAPNDHMELGNHAEFLGVMPSSEMLTRWFINDAANAGVYRLKGHAEEDFWRWGSTWAACLSKPSDLGYSDDGFVLPPLEIIDVPVSVDCSGFESGQLIRADKLNATKIHKEMRRTANARAVAVAELLAREGAGPSRPWVIWCNTDYEADALKAVIPDAAEVRGSMKDAVKERVLGEFSDGKLPVLITKPSVAGFGMNWQHVANMAFVGLSYSFEQFYQAVRRSWRFGQSRPVKAHVVYAETEGEVVAAVRRKQADHELMKASAVAAMREHGLGIGRRELRMAFTHRIANAIDERGQPCNMPGRDSWELHLGDCVEVAKQLPDESIDFTIFSPPFSNLYIYSDSYRDMGNTADDGEFFQHFKFLIPELLRLTVPGRLCAVHCKDLPKYRGRDGSCGLKDFPGDLVRAFEAAGWIFHSRVTIWKCPVVERERTNNNGLLHSTVMRDSSQVRQGMADYLLVFRKNPTEDNLSLKPISRPEGFTDWPGDPACDPRQNAVHPSNYARRPGTMPRLIEHDGRQVDLTPSVSIWQRLADPVWFHIDQRDVLNYELARGREDERHICPLQLGVIKEAVYLWTNPGDKVFTPFAGIGSELYQSILLGRRAAGIELKESYWNVACRNAEKAEREANQPDLFSGIDDEVPAREPEPQLEGVQ